MYKDTDFRGPINRDPVHVHIILWNTAAMMRPGFGPWCEERC